MGYCIVFCVDSELVNCVVDKNELGEEVLWSEATKLPITSTIIIFCV